MPKGLSFGFSVRLLRTLLPEQFNGSYMYYLIEF